MYIRSAVLSLTTRALAEAMPTDVMVRVAKDLIPGYDIYERTGFPPAIPIPIRDAARQIVQDIAESYNYLPFIEYLVRISDEGLMGRAYPFPQLAEIMRELAKDGLTWDASVGLFVEPCSAASTPNWRRLREGVEYPLTLLRFDIVSNTMLVRNHETGAVRATYEDLRSIVKNAADKRNGRVWSLEGDGGLVAFFYGKRDVLATLAGMEILHELFVYNRFRTKLGEPIRVRIAVHSGPCAYSPRVDELEQGETVKRIKLYESEYTLPDTLTASPPIASSMDRLLASNFDPFRATNTLTLHRYALRWEEVGA